ncbi:hypothetical protein MRX96_054337 [Rhipicephalus microplus]
MATPGRHLSGHCPLNSAPIAERAATQTALLLCPRRLRWYTQGSEDDGNDEDSGEDGERPCQYTERCERPEGLSDALEEPGVLALAR